MITYNQINDAFNTIATAHKQINTYGIGDIWEIATSGTIRYPLMWAKPESGSVEGKTYVSKFKIILMDLVHKGESNENDVISDMEQVALDVIAVLKDSNYAFELLSENIPLERFTEKFYDEVAGVTIDISLRIPFNADRCAIPTSTIYIGEGIRTGGSSVTGSGSGSSGGGSGSVTSVGLTMPSIFDVSGNPITSSGTLAVSFASQSQNLVLASPNGSSGTPSFRALVASDIPALSYGDALVSNPLSQFASTSSSQLRGVISDETGTGALVFATSPTLVTPDLGVATATSINSTTIPSSKTLVTTVDTQTLTNKRITKRVDTVTSSATPTINTDTTDVFTITALATAITSMTTNLSGTPTEGQTLLIRIIDNGTARAITWGASFVSRTATLPTTTVISKYTYVGLIYNSVASKWDCIVVGQEP